MFDFDTNNVTNGQPETADPRTWPSICRLFLCGSLNFTVTNDCFYERRSLRIRRKKSKCADRRDFRRLVYHRFVANGDARTVLEIWYTMNHAVRAVRAVAKPSIIAMKPGNYCDEVTNRFVLCIIDFSLVYFDGFQRTCEFNNLI